MKKTIARMSGILAALSPSIAFASLSAPVTDANSLVLKTQSFIYVAIWALVSLGVLFVIWNAVRSIIHADDAEKRKTYQAAIIWGIVGLFAILSIWGLVTILQNTFGTNNYVAPSSQGINNLVPQGGSSSSSASPAASSGGSPTGNFGTYQAPNPLNGLTN